MTEPRYCSRGQKPWTVPWMACTGTFKTLSGRAQWLNELRKRRQRLKKDPVWRRCE